MPQVLGGRWGYKKLVKSKALLIILFISLVLLLFVDFHNIALQSIYLIAIIYFFIIKIYLKFKNKYLEKITFTITDITIIVSCFSIIILFLYMLEVKSLKSAIDYLVGNNNNNLVGNNNNNLSKSQVITYLGGFLTGIFLLLNFINAQRRNDISQKQVDTAQKNLQQQQKQFNENLQQQQKNLEHQQDVLASQQTQFNKTDQQKRWVDGTKQIASQNIMERIAGIYSLLDLSQEVSQEEINSTEISSTKTIKPYQKRVFDVLCSFIVTQSNADYNAVLEKINKEKPITTSNPKQDNESVAEYVYTYNRFVPKDIALAIKFAFRPKEDDEIVALDKNSKNNNPTQQEQPEDNKNSLKQKSYYFTDELEGVKIVEGGKNDNDTINLAQCKFAGHVDFREIQVKSIVFDSSFFYGTAYFKGAKFLGKALFRKVNFLAKVSKENSLEYKTIFENSIFNKKASFEDAIFSNHYASFEGAIFVEETSFTRAKFGRVANFSSATFGDYAIFDNATFGYYAIFDDATFGDYAIFDNATFGYYANFNGATFYNGASFSSATFLGSINVNLKKGNKQAMYNSFSLLYNDNTSHNDFDFVYKRGKTLGEIAKNGDFSGVTNPVDFVLHKVYKKGTKEQVDDKQFKDFIDNNPTLAKIQANIKAIQDEIEVKQIDFTKSFTIQITKEITNI